MSASDSVQLIQRGLEALLRMSSSRGVYAKQAQAADVGISQPAYVLLKRIQADGPLPMGELARRIHMDPGAAARQVGQLERDGYVRRYASPDDGRVNLVVVTPRGDAARRRIARVLDGHMLNVLGSWSERDRREFARLLGRFVDDLRMQEYPAVLDDESA